MTKTARDYVVAAIILAVVLYYASPYLKPMMDHMHSIYMRLPHF